MGKNVICIAGKNNIAVNVALYIQSYYKEFELIACCNANDNCENSFQRSFKSFCILNKIEIVNLKDLYTIDNLIFLSLEFDKIIRPSLFSSEKLFNIHFSYLPEYKGMYTSALPILNGEVYSGVTLHKIDAGIDTGDIIQQRKIELNHEITAEELYFKYIEYGSALVIENLENIINNKIESTIQNSHNSSYYSKSAIDYSNIVIDLNKTAFQIKSQIRAFTFPSYQLPTIFDHAIYRAVIQKEKSSCKPGKILYEDEFYLLVSTIDFNIKLYIDLRDTLFETAKKGDLEQLKRLINNNYDIYQRSKQGWDIAIIAAYNGNIEFLTYLIDHCNWDINTKNYNGTTLIMYLMTYCSLNDKASELVNFLKQFNLDKNQIDFSNKDIIYYSEKYNNPEIIKIIKKYFNDKVS